MQKLKKMEKFYLPRKRSAAASILPLYCNCSRRQAYRKLSHSEKWIHIIPVLLLLCMIILWWSSCSESLVLNKREALMSTVRGVEKPKSLNETRVDFALLAKSAAVAKPPYASISRMNPAGNQSVAAVPANAAQNQ